MTGSDPHAPDSRSRWHERRRFLLATLAITLLYLGIQAIWMRAAAELAHWGWTLNDPAQTYAAEAVRIAEKSRHSETLLAPGFQQGVFQLGYEYGYLSQWLGGYGQQPEAVMRQLSHPVAAHIQRLNDLTDQLGVAPAARLPVRTAADFSQLTQRIEDDPSGLAGRVEQVSSPRLRHLFLLATHIGAECAALESPGDLTPIPASELIGRHATLAGVAEPLWRPLSRIARGSRENVLSDYRTAITRLEISLANTPGPGPSLPE